jgi:hypothetical protein
VQTSHAVHCMLMQALMERFDELLSTSRDEGKESKDESRGGGASREDDRDDHSDTSKRKPP